MEAPNPHAGAVAVPGKHGALDSWLSHLRTLVPPQGLIHVGAGSGADLPDYAQWGLSRLLLVEADEANAKSLNELAREHAGWQVRHALVGQSEGDAVFHVASNARESGLLSAEAQRPLWRNLQDRSQRVMSATSLDQLLSRDGSSQPNWLIVDCLPAASLLRAAPLSLEHCDVLLARVAIATPAAMGQAPGSTLTDLTDLLHGRGLHLVAVEEERMPLLGQALFVRFPGEVRSDAAIAIAQSKEELTRVQSELAGDKLRLEESNAAVIALRQSLQSVQQDAIQLRQASVDLEMVNTDLRQSLISVEATNADLRQFASQAETNIADLKQIITDTENSCDELRRSVTAKEASNTDLLTSLAQVESEQAELRQRLASLNTEATGLRETNEQLQSEIRDLNAQLSCRAESEMALVNAQQVGIDEATALSARLSDAKAEYEHLARDNSELSERYSHLQSNFTALNEQRLEFERLVNVSVAQLGEHKEMLSSRDSEIEALRTRTDELQRLATEQQSRAAELEREKRAIEESLSLTHNHAHLLEVEREQANQRLQAQTIEIANKEGQVARLTQELAEHVSKLNECRRQLGRAEKDRQHFDLEMAKADAQISLIRDVLLRGNLVQSDD